MTRVTRKTVAFLLLALLEVNVAMAGLQLEVATDKIAYKPGEPVKVTVNLDGAIAENVTGRLTVVVGYDLAAEYTILDKPVELKGEKRAGFEAVWQSPQADLWGCEVQARLLSGSGKIMARDRRVFVVSDNLPRAAANRADISPWIFKTGVSDPVAHLFDYWQRLAIPMCEIFCWEPSNWGNIYPKTDRWICGQMRYPYTFKEIDHIVEQAHRRGIFLMTYARVTYNGSEGYRYAKAHPEAVWYKNPNGELDETLTEADLKAWDEAAADPKYSLVRRDELKLFEATAKLTDPTVLDEGIDQYIKAIKRFGFDGIRWDGHPGSPYHPMLDANLRASTGGKVNTLYYDYQGKALAPDDPDADYLRVVRRFKTRFRAALPELVFGYNIQAWNKSVPDSPEIITPAQHPRAHAELFPDAVILDEKHFAYQNKDGTLGMHSQWSKTTKFWLRGNQLLRRFGAYHYTGGMPNAGSDAFLMHSYSLAYICGARAFGVAVPFERFLKPPDGAKPQPAQYNMLLTFAQRYAQYFFHPSAVDVVYREGQYAGDRIKVSASRPVVWEEFGKAVTDRGSFTLVAHLWNKPVEDLMRANETVPPPVVEQATVTIKQPVGLPWAKAKAYVLSYEWDKWQQPVEIDTSKREVTIAVPPFQYWAVVMLQYPLEPQPLEKKAKPDSDEKPD